MTRHWLTLQSLLFLMLVLAIAALALPRSAPYVLRVDAPLLQGEATRAFEAHYDAQFPARTLGINLWAAIDYVLFGEGRPGVVVGRQHWLYSDEEFALAADTPAVVERNLALIRWVRTQLVAHNVRLVVAVVPAKARVYPEFLGERQPPRLQQDLHRRVHEHLQAEGMTAPDLFAVLSAAKAQAPTFLRTDTHWTPWGAQQAAQALAAPTRRALGPASSRLRQRYRSVSGAELDYPGDLFSFLPLDPYFAGLLPPADRLLEQRTELVADAGAGGGLLDERPAPRVALVGTSYSAHDRWNFAGALRQALGEDVANYAREGLGPYRPMLDYLAGPDFRRAPPRVLIWELPERYLALPQDLDGYALPAALITAPVAAGAPTAKEAI
jgi:alginate O-acetyltransferase complex protein AlgJ